MTLPRVLARVLLGGSVALALLGGVEAGLRAAWGPPVSPTTFHALFHQDRPHAASGAPVVDIASVARRRVRDGGRLFVDNLHLAAAGHALVADALAPEVARALPSP